MRAWFTRRHWAELWNIMLARLGRPKALPAAVEARLEAARKMRESSGVRILQMDVWSEGPNPCKAHCWHRVHASNSHRGAVGQWKVHLDYMCCQCTHGLCHVAAGEGPVVAHPIPKQHARIKR